MSSLPPGVAGCPLTYSEGLLSQFDFSYLLWINKTDNPKITDETINSVFNNPSTENDSRIKMVEIINPEFLITL
jgi:hypothetical protein